ncbi:MAG: tetratricopeptide repeat protein [Phycisphaerae bacterium]
MNHRLRHSLLRHCSFAALLWSALLLAGILPGCERHDGAPPLPGGGDGRNGVAENQSSTLGAGGAPATADTSANYPQIPELVTGKNPDGSLTLDIDTNLFSQFCVSLNLPAPPPPEAIDTTAYIELYNAAKRLSRNPDANHYAAVGAIYYAYAYRENAIQCFRQAKRRAPTDHRWPHLLARLYKDVGRLHDAVTEIEVAAGLDERYAATFALAGDLYLAAARFQDAGAAYSKYVALRPQDAYGYFGLGKLAHQQRQFEKAAGYLRQALSHAPNAYQIKYLYGRSLLQLGQREQAAKELAATGTATSHEGITFEDPLFQQVHIKARSILALRADYQRQMAAQDWNAAANACRAILERRPEDFGTMYNLASLYRQLGDYDRALTLLRRALKTKPDFAPLRCGLAEVYLAMGDPRRAIAETERALDGDPRQARALAVKGAAHLSLREWPLAESALTEATKLDPQQDRYFYYLGNALEAQDRRSDAINAYKAAIRLNAANAPAHQRLSALSGP